MAPRKPKAKAATAPVQTNQFADAMKFLGMITSLKGPVNETHICLGYGWAAASNGMLTGAHKIPEPISIAPNHKLLSDALAKCGQSISFITTDANRLQVKSDKFKAVIPCIDPTLIALSGPDPLTVNVDNKLSEAIQAVGILANEDAVDIVAASILINGQSIMATNRAVVFEYYHGFELPTGIPLPKAVVAPLAKIGKNLVGFGCSNNSVTFHFEDESWLKTQLYAGEWPDCSALFNREFNMLPLPPDFFAGVEAVAPFSTDGFVYFDNEIMRSSQHKEEGATYEVKALPKGPAYNWKYLMMMKPHVQQIDFFSKANHHISEALMFYGPNIRGIIAGRSKSE